MNIYSEVMQDISREKTKRENLKNLRIKEVYKSIPRIKEIDSQITELGIQYVNKALQNVNIESLKGEISLLKKEKESLLKANYSLDYLSNNYSCNLCKDTGNLNFTRCNCVKTRVINKYIKISGLDYILGKENFDNFDIRYFSNIVNPDLGISPLESIQAIYKEALNFCKSFDVNYSNLLFYGDPGLGKTFICNCISKEIIDMGKPVLYVTSPQLAKHIESERFKKDEESIIQSIEIYYNCPLLIIDDLGTEFSTIVTQSELFNIINFRLLKRYSTIISTNLNPADLANMYSTRLVSRIFGEYKTFKFIGNDIRIQKKMNI